MSTKKVDVTKTKGILPMNVKHARPSSVKPTEQDLKWCEAFCAVRNAFWDMSADLSQAACECFNLGNNAKKVMTKEALLDYLCALENRLQSIQSGLAGVVGSAHDYIGEDMFRACKEIFSKRGEEERAKMIRETDERCLRRLAAKLGKKVL